MVPGLISFREEEELSGTSKMINKTTEGGIRKLTRGDYFTYLKAVRDVLEDEEKIYHDFTQLLKDYSTQRLDLESVIDMVKNLFEGHPDLLMGFNTFLPKGYEITITPTTPDFVSEEALTFVKRVKARFQDEYHVYLSFIEILKGENKSRIFPKVAALFRDHPDLIDEFTHFLPSEPSCSIDLSNCETCTPSYHVLPEDYPIPAATRRTLLDSQVLNDRVCITPSAASCSRGIHKSRCEQSLFQCENDMFELDMLLSSVNSTIGSVEQLIQKIENNSISASICLEDHLTVLNLRCIERLYGKQGLEVVDLLRENADAALPVILVRLKQKQEEWEQCRSDFSQVWAQVYAKNLNNQANHDV
ncbi:paired amphipathic helix protein Sin3-like 4 [Rosa rugosa]|uniref:paired amphipathic helix protein Sin3-like 4 n=1 Tax=Rosa rugosa TaxID=74645 RepID=UPI002B404B32|nr:paired amphipathic helix protein Sin3-like 4 [Rosa rugosa]